MSAYLVDNYTITTIVNAAVIESLIPDTAQARQSLGQLLLAVNDASVAYRYSEDLTETVYDPEEAPLGRVHESNTDWGDGNETLGALRCFNYQACEEPDYPQGYVSQLIDALIKKVSK